MNYRSSTPIIDLVYPRRCPICDKAVPYGKIICDPCREQPERTGHVTCVKCGRKIADPREEYCPDCRRVRRQFKAGASVFTYRSVSGGILRFKYRERREYAAYFGREMADLLLRKIDEGWPEPDLLVPVPIHRKRRRKRGYNQAFLLAEEIARQTGFPAAEALERRVNTAPLKFLTARGRSENLKSAFHASQMSVKSKITILIDDIYTTGATADACAAELYRAGAAQVYVLSLSS